MAWSGLCTGGGSDDAHMRESTLLRRALVRLVAVWLFVGFWDVFGDYGAAGLLLMV